MNDVYRQAVLDRFHHPRFKGVVEKAGLTASESNPLCGDTISLEMTLNNGRIVEVAWQGEGCAISLAAADFLSEKMIGLTIAEIKNLTTDDMLGLLGIDLGPARLKCVSLALMAMQKTD